MPRAVKEVLKMSSAAVETALGFVGVSASSLGLRRVTLPQPSPEAAIALLRETSEAMRSAPASLGDLPHRLRRYFEGERVSFDDELDLEDATPFARAVFEATRSIPLGETRSYAWVARQMGKPRAARAVGQALASNPLCVIIPCHRVIGSDGGLCGFGGGLALKKRLLEHEARVVLQTSSFPTLPPSNASGGKAP